ncbi:unnamed protein product [Callosobruchus maculatus]|uniref:Uncharacterized protein n=1 Tax=Callosobruchus maculatus TaxID=64391 RepID=A0A653CUA6_CALMS|nr:unnamed protein product [Callosobruchus maculatus]
MLRNVQRHFKCQLYVCMERNGSHLEPFLRSHFRGNSRPGDDSSPEIIDYKIRYVSDTSLKKIDLEGIEYH